MRRDTVVVGAGTMGAGLALLLAARGSTVRLTARSADSLERARSRIGAALTFLAAEQWLPPDRDVVATLGAIETTTDLEAALARADLVLEAVTEDPGVKRDVYRRIGAGAPRSALVASTTSGLDVFGIAGDFPAPERLIIAHFWNPPYLIPLVEIVPGPATSAEVVRVTEALVREWGGTPVTLSRYVPGFIGVRLNSALYREAVALIEAGVTDAAGIDAVMRDSIALRFPVLDAMAVVDFGGLDTFARVWAQMFPEISAAREVPAGVQRAVADGAFGVKAGRGFHDYRGQAADVLLRERDRRLLRWLRERDRYRLGGTPDCAGDGPAGPERAAAGPERAAAGPDTT